MANAATESTIDKIDQTIEDTFVQKAVRWVFSAGGMTICLTILVAIVATIHKGPYILVNTVITGGMWALMAIICANRTRAAITRQSSGIPTCATGATLRNGT